MVAVTPHSLHRRYCLRRYIVSLQTELRRNNNVIRSWPPAPRRLPAALLQGAYRRWRAYLTLKPVPREQWPQLKMKICAASALRGRRPLWGQNRQWLGDYLADNKYNPKAGQYLRHYIIIILILFLHHYVLTIFKFPGPIIECSNKNSVVI